MRLRSHRGNALAETIVALLALTPVLMGIVALGKQLDIKHKTFDAARYSVWERSVWSHRGSNAKTDADVTLESLDRVLGNPQAGVLSAVALREQGVSENPLWRDRHQRRLLVDDSPLSTTHDDRISPVDAGYVLIPALAHGEGALATAAQAMQMDDLKLNRRGFAEVHVAAGLKSAQLVQQARGAILSDTWSPRNESELRRRIDDVTADELIEQLELPGRALSLQARGKGEPLYGEGQYSLSPDLRPRTTVLPATYVTDRDDDRGAP